MAIYDVSSQREVTITGPTPCNIALISRFFNDFARVYQTSVAVLRAASIAVISTAGLRGHMITARILMLLLIHQMLLKDPIRVHHFLHVLLLRIFIIDRLLLVVIRERNLHRLILDLSHIHLHGNGITATLAAT